MRYAVEGNQLFNAPVERFFRSHTFHDPAQLLGNDLQQSLLLRQEGDSMLRCPLCQETDLHRADRLATYH
jgi:hypothetical protein